MKEKRHLGNFYHVLKLFFVHEHGQIMCMHLSADYIAPDHQRQFLDSNSNVDEMQWALCSSRKYVLFILLILSNVERDKSNISSRQSSVVTQLNPRDNHINE